MEEKSKTTLVQEKIKQMMQNRRKISSREGPGHLKRLTSNLQSENNEEQSNQQQFVKPSSSNRNRPRTSIRPKNEQSHSVTTDSSNKNDIDVPHLITQVFERGFEITKYLNKNNMQAQECQNKLLNNALFHTLIISKLSKENEDDYMTVVQREIIAKLQKIKIMEKQTKQCQMLQHRINSLINDRLKSLSNY